MMQVEFVHSNVTHVEIFMDDDHAAVHRWRENIVRTAAEKKRGLLPKVEIPVQKPMQASSPKPAPVMAPKDTGAQKPTPTPQGSHDRAKFTPTPRTGRNPRR